MDQARCWMTGLISNSSNLQGSTYDDSWEEQAFAEDASGALWPPRSYSCSFCAREFASAQALGGHMNVHRRDRARLKQSPQDESDLHRHDIHSLVYNPNPNPNSDPSSNPDPLSLATKSWSSSFGLNLIVKEEIGCKRKRSDEYHTASLLPFFVKPISNSIEFESRRHVRVRSVKVSDHDQLSSDDDIDLELRLGVGKV